MVVYGLFGQINMHGTLDFCSRPAIIEIKVTPPRTTRIESELKLLLTSAKKSAQNSTLAGIS